jgi:hypothetical protein
MTDLTKWNYYYNLEGDEQVRANLVYTPYISPDGKTFCMSFNRDPGYHTNLTENSQWNTDSLTGRFYREIDFWKRASNSMPVLKMKDIDEDKRTLFFEWHGDDFYMQAIKAGGYDRVLPNWQEQWTTLIKKMWSADIIKISLHPNSWTVKDGELIPFNWFYSYDMNETAVIRDMLKQISSSRQEKMKIELEKVGLNIDTPYPIKDLQVVAFNSFRSNYPNDLIDNIIQEHVWA